jgi:hypothetical protein
VGSSTPRQHLFVVARHFPGLYGYMREHFASEPDVAVVLDRRRGQRRSRAAPAAVERRAADRRQREEIDRTLRTDCHAFLTRAG